MHYQHKQKKKKKGIVFLSQTIQFVSQNVGDDCALLPQIGLQPQIFGFITKNCKKKKNYKQAFMYLHKWLLVCSSHVSKTQEQVSPELLN